MLSENDKAVVWVANVHLENDVVFARVVKKLGVFLKENYGDHYFNTGLSESADQQSEIIYHAQNLGRGKKYESTNSKGNNWGQFLSGNETLWTNLKEV